MKITNWSNFTLKLIEMSLWTIFSDLQLATKQKIIDAMNREREREREKFPIALN